MTQGGAWARLVLIGAIVAGLSFLVATIWLGKMWAVGLSPAGVAWLAAWKGAGVALLALWCAMQARTPDGWLITAVMAFGALGDVLLETQGTVAGASAFIAGHVTAIALYLRNRRQAPSMSQMLLAAVLVPVVIFKAWTLPADPALGQISAFYALFLGLMGATAWLSRFPRYWTGIGAMLFVASDLLIFARMGALAGAGWVSPVIWLLYFAGQALIAIGVVRTLVTRN
jgi:uncharacterized membrane protein YhhN